jgi:hypothetical protein
MANSARITTNLLDYIPGMDVISPAAWNANSALMIYKLPRTSSASLRLYVESCISLMEKYTFTFLYNL